MKEVPIWQKSNLTLEEAAAYSGIGINKLRSMTDSDECKFVLWNGTKRLIKRRKLDEYLDKAFSIRCGSKIDCLVLQGVLRHGILMA